MRYATFMDSFPALDVPIDESIVTAKAIASDAGLVVFFTFHQDFELPPHSHKGQWGTVITGEVELTMNGVTKAYGPGETYDIPSGTVHSARVRAGTQAIDVFEENNRYGLKA
jgi:quercetin dioxygenase-like cupin family protein